jgi:glycerate 2-kinase
MRVGLDDPRQFLLALFQTAVAAADPHRVLPPCLPYNTERRAIVIGAGKAAAAMASALEKSWAGELSGLVVTPYGHGEPCRHIEVIEASHPVPDARGEQAATRILELVSGLSAGDLVICLLSGGGSALLSLPAPGITLADKRDINRQLLQSGAPIHEINCVRKHLSGIKGGRLARACYPAQLITFAISDVPGDDPAVIASGPTVGDSTRSAEALAILQRYDITVGPHVLAWLQNPGSETLQANDPVFVGSQFHVIATAQQSLEAAARAARDAGIEVLQLGDIQGEAREVARVQAALALARQHGEPSRSPCLILSGGETTVTINGSGRGGRNTEYLLSLAIALAGASAIHALAADTDGIDGSQDNAGALLTPASWTRAHALGLDAEGMLADNDSYSFFAALDDLLVTGPTRTNVNDFRAVLVLPAGN